ncbi:MAG TPA: ferrochelatase [Longimicrobiales bacterium]|nr:ferrochelatase [Longimicrobiales bacterium]
MIGVVLLNFGEPERATMEEVVPFLERIFLTNASLEGRLPPEQARARSHELAVRRAPGLIEEYEMIGGSPFLAQARAQVDGLASELERRGVPARVYLAMQFTDPSIPETVERAKADGVTALVGLPVYPLAGPSTTVAALAALAEAIRDAGWEVPVHEVTGWHRHPLYVELRVDAIRRTLREHGLDLSDPATRLVFSAHGTPVKYLREGSRYDVYVREHCAEVAAAVGAADYAIGYQNHGNRPVEWTQPDIDAVVKEIDAKRIVVDPVSFMHEQSETLAELDHELREVAEERGLEFYRVPILHDDARFSSVLADLVEAVTDPARAPGGFSFQACTCRGGKAVCISAR